MLRIGLLVDGAQLSVFDAELVRRLQAAGIAQVALVIEQQLPAPSLGARIRRALRRGTLARAAAFRFAVWIEKRLTLPGRPEIGDLFRSVAVEQVCDAERLAVRPQISPSGFVHRFRDADVRAIRERQLDAILRMGSGILRGEILRAATHGILSFHHGDNRSNRGGPAGYWEVQERRDTTGYIVQRLGEELDAGEVLARGEVGTQPRYLLNQYHLFRCSLASMLDLLARLDRDGALPRAEADVDWYAHALYTLPPVRTTLAYLGALARRALARLARRLLAQRDVWELRVLQADWRRLALHRARALAPRRGTFWADPFIVGRRGAEVIFFEEYEFDRGKAHIAALVGSGDGAFEYAGAVVRTPYHLSFPFVFQHQGQYYMCPESHEARTIELWRCTGWPLQWQREKTLFRDFDACDTLLFERGGRWWLLTNLDRDGAGDFCRELHVYHADSPLAERWTPHPGNPVVTGASRARNAGLLQRDGRIYRVAQAQGFDLYGRALKLFEITALSERAYEERPVAEAEPQRALRARGLHHLSASDETVVFDALRPRLFWSARLARGAPGGLSGAARSRLWTAASPGAPRPRC